MIVFQVFGSNPGSHHLASVLIHAITTALVLLFFKRATGHFWPSVVVAFLFGLHPLHVESVAWVSERKDALSGLFWFLALCLYLRYTVCPGLIRYVLLLVAFLLGLMSKPMLVSLPIILLFLDVWPLRRLRLGQDGWNLAVLREKIPLAALSLAVCVVTIHAQKGAGFIAGSRDFPWAERIGNALFAYCVYIAKTVWPSRLAMPYPYPTVAWWQAVFGGLVVLSVSCFVIKRLRSHAFLAVGWFWFIITLIPVIGIIQVGSQPRADRYMYIPLVGLAIVLAWGGREVLARWPNLRGLAAGVGFVLCIVTVLITSTQIHYWRGSETLFRHTLAVTEGNALPHLLLSEYYLSEKRGQEAVVEGQNAVRLLPNAAEARINFAAALETVGRHAESVQEYRRATQLQPQSAIAHSGLALELARMGQPQQALEEFRLSARLDPTYASNHYNFAGVLLELNRQDEALAEYTTATVLDPDNSDYHCGLGIALGSLQRTEEAIPEFQIAIRLQTANASAHFNLGSALAIEGRLDEAIVQFSEALKIEPGLPGHGKALRMH